MLNCEGADTISKAFQLLLKSLDIEAGRAVLSHITEERQSLLPGRERKEQVVSQPKAFLMFAFLIQVRIWLFALKGASKPN